MHWLDFRIIHESSHLSCKDEGFDYRVKCWWSDSLLFCWKHFKHARKKMIYFYRKKNDETFTKIIERLLTKTQQLWKYNFRIHQIILTPPPSLPSSPSPPFPSHSLPLFLRSFIGLRVSRLTSPMLYPCPRTGVTFNTWRLLLCESAVKLNSN